MRLFFLSAIALLIVSGVLAIIFTIEHPVSERIAQENGSGLYYEKREDMGKINRAVTELLGRPTIVNHQEPGEAKNMSGPTWKAWLRHLIHDPWSTIKNLPATVAPQPRLAPPGVYFTLTYLSVRNPSGVTGVSAGTRVVCIKDEGTVMLVKAGDLEFEAKRPYLTNNLDLADIASRNDVEAQQTVKSAIAEQQVMDKARRDKENAAFDQRQREIAARKAAEAEASAYQNPLERGPYNRIYDVSGPPGGSQTIIRQPAPLATPQ